MITKQNDREEQKKGIIATIVVHLLLLLLILFFGFKVPQDDDSAEGMMIAFGTYDEGSGDNALSEMSEVKPVKAEQPTKAEDESKTENEQITEIDNIEKEVITQDEIEAPVLTNKEKKVEEEKKEVEKESEKKVDTEEKTESTSETEVVEETEEEAEKAAEKEQPTVNDDLLFKGTDKNAKKSGKGNTDKLGDQGAKDGDKNSDNFEGTGLGDEGYAYDLTGRKMTNKIIAKDNSQKTGTVVVKIKVDQYGQVISADYTALGSTTTDSYLKNLAIEAARKAQFNKDLSASEIQQGTITFNFKVQ